MMNIATFSSELEFLNTTVRITLGNDDAGFVIKDGVIELDIGDAGEITQLLLYKRFAGYFSWIINNKLFIGLEKVTTLGRARQEGLDE